MIRAIAALSRMVDHERILPEPVRDENGEPIGKNGPSIGKRALDL